jgi:hypothetical protein
LWQVITFQYFSTTLKFGTSRYLNENLKHKIFVASANALKLCLHYQYNNISYSDVHKKTKREIPSMIDDFECALQLYKTFNVAGLQKNEDT